MLIGQTRFVDFEKCNDCINKDIPEDEEPCRTCMITNVRSNTATPINFTETED